jgi:hypothetical protein
MSPEWSFALAGLEQCNQKILRADASDLAPLLEERGQAVGRIVALIAGTGPVDVEVCERLLRAIREGDAARRHLAIFREQTRVKWDQLNCAAALMRTMRGSAAPSVSSTIDCCG